MNFDQILARAIEASGAASDSDLSRKLGVSRQAVSNWRGGKKFPDTVTCATIAGITGIPLAQVLGVVGEARAISREEKAVWRKLAATAMLVAISVGMSATPTAARASGFEKGPVCILCKAAASLMGYYSGLLKLLLASLLPLRGSKDKASIDACAST